MTARQLAERLGAAVIAAGDLNKEIESGYAGDFLSNVIGKAGDGAAWFTVMNNVNVAAVASLIDAAAIILCEGVLPDAALLEKAKANNINILSVKEDVFSAITALKGEI